jgi:hypothetical protein
MMTVDEIFADDRRNPPSERSLPWEETRGGVTVVVEPKPHWAEDMRAFRLDAREYCRYADWTTHGARTRFYGHIDTLGRRCDNEGSRDDRPRDCGWPLELNGAHLAWAPGCRASLRRQRWIEVQLHHCAVSFSLRDGGFDPQPETFHGHQPGKEAGAAWHLRRVSRPPVRGKAPSLASIR